MSPCVESVASRSRAERGRPMTPKQRVLKKWPKAWEGPISGGIYADIGHWIGKTWADAARRLKERKYG